MKNILLIDAQPDEARLASSLLSAYKKGAEASGFEVTTLTTCNLSFELNLKLG